MQAIFTCEKPEQRDTYRQVLINCGADCGADDAVLFSDLWPRVNRGGAQLLVVLLGSEPRDTLKLVHQINETKPLPTIVIGPSHDAQLIMQAMNVGAREYLDIDMPRDGLTKALEKLRKSGAIEIRRGSCIAVTGAVPGSGVTTVASGLAFSLGATHPKQVVLGELGVGVPELALDLDLKPKNSVSQLLHDWDRIDASTVRQAAIEHAGGIHILADMATNQRSVTAGDGACRQLISLIRTMFDYAVYDIGHGAQTAVAQQTVRMADRVVVVVRLDVPSLRLTRGLINRLADYGMLQQNLVLVANRYGQRKQIDWRKVEETLGLPVTVWLPDDPGTVNQALNFGLPLTHVSSWSKLNRRLTDLAQIMNGTPAK